MWLPWRSRPPASVSRSSRRRRLRTFVVLLALGRFLSLLEIQERVRRIDGPRQPELARKGALAVKEVQIRQRRRVALANLVGLLQPAEGLVGDAQAIAAGDVGVGVEAALVEDADRVPGIGLEIGGGDNLGLLLVPLDRVVVVAGLLVDLGELRDRVDAVRLLRELVLEILDGLVVVAGVDVEREQDVARLRVGGLEADVILERLPRALRVRLVGRRLRRRREEPQVSEPQVEPADEQRVVDLQRLLVTFDGLIELAIVVELVSLLDVVPGAHFLASGCQRKEKNEDALR